LLLKSLPFICAPAFHGPTSVRAPPRARVPVRAWQVVGLACLLPALAWVPTLGRVHQALHSGDHRAVPIQGLAHTGHAAMLRTSSSCAQAPPQPR
jgi:hypothetical protein